MAERGVASRSRSKSQVNRRVSKKGVKVMYSPTDFYYIAHELRCVLFEESTHLPATPEKTSSPLFAQDRENPASFS